MSEVVLTLSAAERLAVDVLTNHKTSEPNAREVAQVLVAAEAEGQAGHGLSRLPSYAAQSASGKVNGIATPLVERLSPAMSRVDARGGFAYPALTQAVRVLSDSVPETLVAAAAVWNSHHCGMAGYTVERLARDGLIALMFANTPKAIAPWNGQHAVFGTNPIAFAAPRANAAPVVIDMSMSKVARGKIMVAARQNRSIPLDWAVDTSGQPTSDPQAALDGSILPFGDAKGAQLALLVEILAAALTGSNLSYEASSFFSGAGDPPAVGQLLIAFAPDPVSGERFGERMECLTKAILAQSGTRLPGARRLALRAKAEVDGITIDTDLYQELNALTGDGRP
ncbi:MAG: Ldh family oxidoreductase [Gammaproteobacteria bacterium]|nr:Ldh family oxidoreductase [Gammaproteobacteria bacterium]